MDGLLRGGTYQGRVTGRGRRPLRGDGKGTKGTEGGTPTTCQDGAKEPSRDNQGALGHCHLRGG